MTDGQRFQTFEEALNEAVDLLSKKFDEPDQCAAVDLANVLYTMQERQRFETREREPTDVAYRG